MKGREAKRREQETLKRADSRKCSTEVDVERLEEPSDLPPARGRRHGEVSGEPLPIPSNKGVAILPSYTVVSLDPFSSCKRKCLMSSSQSERRGCIEAA